MCCVYLTVQKLSHYDQASDDAVPWMWTVLEHSTATEYPSSESGPSAVSVEARVVAFFRLVTQLPSTAIVTCPRSPTVKVQGLVQLCDAVNNLGRNMSDMCTLLCDLTLHLVLTLASLPVEVNNDLRQFLSDCPLITLSAMSHIFITGSAVNLTSCTNAVTDMLRTVSSALDEATVLLDGGTLPHPSELPTWLHGAALWSRLRSTQYTADVSRLRLDTQTAESLLHCLTLDMAAGMLQGDDSRQVVQDAAAAVWLHHLDALHCLSDRDCEHSPVAAVLRTCMPDVLQRMQPLACLRLFAHLTNSGLGGQFPSQWNITRTLHWYAHCVRLFDAGSCAIVTVITTLQQASEAICSFAASMPQSELRNVDQTALDAVDPHIRMVFRQFCNV